MKNKKKKLKQVTKAVKDQAGKLIKGVSDLSGQRIKTS